MTTAHNNNPNRCWMKSKLDNCHPSYEQLTGTLMHYDCRDNHNCGGSFVQIKECSNFLQAIENDPYILLCLKNFKRILIKGLL